MWIRGAMCILRPIEEGDIDSIVEQLCLSDLHQTTFPLQVPRNRSWFVQRYVLGTTDAASRYKFGIVPTSDSAGTVVGTVDLFEIDYIHRNAELGYQIFSAKHRRAGLGADAVQASVTWGFDYLGLHRIYARVLADNVPSQRLLERMGFRQEGTLRQEALIGGRYLDVGLYGRLATDEVDDHT